MRLTAYRIVQRQHRGSAFDGEGARINGGRWNSAGTRVVYVASSLSLATLELLVHLDEVALIYGRYVVIPVEFDDRQVQTLSRPLPRNWNAPQLSAATQVLGDQWVAGAASAVLQVPSAVTQNEVNYLLNPGHPDFKRIKLHPAFDLSPDERLRRER